MSPAIRQRSVLDWPTGVTVYDPSKCYNGYSVVTPYQSDLCFLIDMRGRVVHVWHADPERIAGSWFLKRLENGHWLTMNVYFPAGHGTAAVDLVPSIFSDPPFQTSVLELTWAGEVVWRYDTPSGWMNHHDMARLRNGNTLICMDEAVVDTAVSDKVISDNLFVEVSPAGEIVWQWATRDHVEQFPYSDACRRLMWERGGDVFHTNTCAPLPANALEAHDDRFRRGNILSCQRHVNLIYIIDKASGDVVWHWGEGPGELVGPHHPTMLANGNIEFQLPPASHSAMVQPLFECPDGCQLVLDDLVDPLLPWRHEPLKLAASLMRLYAAHKHAGSLPMVVE